MSPAPWQLIAALGGTREPQDPPQQAWLITGNILRPAAPGALDRPRSCKHTECPGIGLNGAAQCRQS